MAVESLRDIRKSGTSAFDAGGGGGSVAPTIVTVNVTPASKFEAVENVIDALVTTASIITASLIPNADFDADDLSDYQLQITPLLGSIDFLITSNGPIVGDYKIAYQILI